MNYASVGIAPRTSLHHSQTSKVITSPSIVFAWKGKALALWSVGDGVPNGDDRIQHLIFEIVYAVYTCTTNYKNIIETQFEGKIWLRSKLTFIGVTNVIAVGKRLNKWVHLVTWLGEDDFVV